MKGRIILWSVVGVLVIAGVLFILLTGKSTRRNQVTIDDLKRQAARTETSINELTAKLAQAKAVPLPAEKVQMLTEAEQKLNQARTLLAEVKNATEPGKANETLRNVHRVIRQVRRRLREATKPKPAGQ